MTVFRVGSGVSFVGLGWYIRRSPLSNSNSGTVITSSSRVISSTTVISLVLSEVSISMHSMLSFLSSDFSVLSFWSFRALISNPKLESGKPKDPSLDEIVKGRSVCCRVFWLGRFSRFKVLVLLYTLLYLLPDAKDTADEGVGDGVGTVLGALVVVGRDTGVGT